MLELNKLLLKDKEQPLNKEQKQDNLIYQFENWPLDKTGKLLKEFLIAEDKYIEIIFEEVDSFFREFSYKIMNQLDSIKEKFVNEILQFYKKGEGK